MKSLLGIVVAFTPGPGCRRARRTLPLDVAHDVGRGLVWHDIHAAIYDPDAYHVIAVAVLIVRSLSGPRHGAAPPQHPPPGARHSTSSKNAMRVARSTKTSLRNAAA